MIDLNKEPLFNYAAFPKKLNLGCGFDYLQGFLNVDLNDFHHPDLIADITDLKMLPSGYYDEILAQDVLEHLPRIKTKIALIEWNRLLRIGGLLDLRVPNMLGLANLLAKEQNATIEMHETLMQCLFGTQAYNGDYHFTSFTDLILRTYLEQTGFEVILLISKDEWLFDCSAKKIKDTFKDIFLEVQSQLLKIRNLDEFVRTTYIKFLEREADIDGYIYYKKMLENQVLTREQFLEAIYSSQEYKNKSKPMAFVK